MSVLLQVIIVLGAILIGVHYKGIGLGMWGGAGLLVLALFCGIKPTSAPINVMLIILAVITCVSMMDAAGGIDYMVRIAERIIRANPNRIVFVAPLITWFFGFLAGTAHIMNSLMPVIYEVSHEVGIRPERPMTVSCIAAQQALVASPVAACTAAILGLFAANGSNINLGQILMITVPATLLAVVITSCVMLHYGKDLKDDPEYQARVAAGLVPPVTPNTEKPPLPSGAKLSMWLFILGVCLAVAGGFVPAIRTPGFDGKPLGMATYLELVMFLTASMICLLCKAKTGDAMKSPIMRAGITAVICVFGLSWLGDSFINAHKAAWVADLGVFVKSYPWLMAVVLFFGSSLLNSQAVTVRTLLPLGFALGIPAPVLLGCYPGVNGTSFLPTSGVLIATIAYDQSGTTKIGKYVLNHSFMVPCVTATTSAVIIALLLQSVLL